MVQKGLAGFFKNYLKKGAIFNNKEALTNSYIPDELIHREDKIQTIASIIGPVLRGEQPSNLFVYGKPGTGKTVSIKYILENLINVAKDEDINALTYYINAKMKRMTDTEYRLIVYLAKKLGKDLPKTGLSTSEVYEKFFEAVEEKESKVILVIDEIDSLIEKSGDELLYILVRKNEDLVKSKLSLIGISNKPNFLDNLDSRVKSSLSQEEILFSPYNAIQLQDILAKRAKVAFNENVLNSGVVEKCAAYAARENGDARRAIDLLRIAAEISERKGFNKVEIKRVDEAQTKIDKDRYFETIKSLPKQFKAVFYSIFNLNLKKKKCSSTDVYNHYQKVASEVSLRPLTQRRVSDILNDLESSGLINMNTFSRGRYGKKRVIKVTIPEMFYSSIKAYLESEFTF